MTIILGTNQYGKAEVRLVKVTRDTPRHEIEDLNVTSQLRGIFDKSFLVGDNSQVLATDTQKNTIYAFAKKYGIGSPEAFLLKLGRHFVADAEWVTGGRWEAEQYSWSRISVDGHEHDHSFVRSGAETRTAVLTKDGENEWLISGLSGLVVLKSTGSEFHGFPRDEYTTLAETDDRLLATSVSARWRLAAVQAEGLDFNELYASVRETMLEAFAVTHSLALQQSIYAMGSRVLERHSEIVEIKISMPNKHHFLVDLEPFGLENPNEVFFAADRPYGLIEATVAQDDAPDAGPAWESMAGFC